jgi:DNA polymerase-1
MLDLEEATHALKTLASASVLYIDTETYGLRPFHGHVLFSIIIGNETDEYYFNFHDYGDGTPVLPRSFIEEIAHNLFTSGKTFVGHNLKYDMHILNAEGFPLPGAYHDTMVTERILNYRLSEKSHDFALADTAERYGAKKEKDLIVEWFSQNPQFVKKTKLWFKKQAVKDKDYSSIPPDKMFIYGVGDIRATRFVYHKQMKRLVELQSYITNGSSIQLLYEQEMTLLGVVANMESRGVLCDRNYVQEAITKYREEKFDLERIFFMDVGEEYKNSAKQNAQIFAEVKDQWSYGAPTAKKGQINPTFGAKALAKLKHPVAFLIIRMNQIETMLKFFGGFEYHMDINDVIHTSFNQHLPCTGRFSSSNPNLQNLKKSDEDDEGKVNFSYMPRRAFIPRPGMKFIAIDYDQMEYKLVLDYANPPELVRLVRDEGMDIHKATGKDAGVTRKKAKFVNFAMLFGASDKLLAKNLGCSTEEAKALRERVLEAHPNLKNFINAVKRKAKFTNIIVNWFGRIYNFHADENYKALNALIQGGCADAAKRAMITTSRYVEKHGGFLVLQIHDEFVFEVPIDWPDEHVKYIVNLMETAYPYKNLPLTASPEVCYNNLQDKEKYVFS